eukprot:CAMPEP_0201740200 /NCGR_PEP_ID=MMETSP0593-20130828/46176_1 /ASSEMBLY_ACC=CAM_ASM_000672 /TAXON_ID=267983 /ORGANISM="Skeletonema japonicum, Strain CCMP2506" /LENGTH=1237 /DNA_ID=CAMNT_0048234505 /DNA_START=28 /DNA_END=3741 /DNA_ORIENTATION=-
MSTPSDAEHHPNEGVRRESKQQNHEQQQQQMQERRIQTTMDGEIITSALEAPMGMPLPPSTTESPGGQLLQTGSVEYSPIYNTRMKTCKGFEAEGLKGYTTLDDLRHDLQLYFYDMNGYSYHRTDADIAVALMTESPTGHPSASPSVSHFPTMARSNLPSTIPTGHPVTAVPTDEPTSSVRLPQEPTKSPSPTMLPKFAGITSPTSTLLNSTSTDNLVIAIPEGALGGDTSNAGSPGGAPDSTTTAQVIFYGDGEIPADAFVDGGEGSTFAPTVPIPSLRTASPSRTPTLRPIELDENQLELGEGSLRKRVRERGDGEVVDSDRRRLQEFAEVMNENGVAELDEVVTMPDGGEVLIPVTLSPPDRADTEGGIHFHICPNTNFQFNNLYVAQLKFLPLIVESPVQTPVTIACLKEHTCTFTGGDYHMVFNNNGLEEDSLGESSLDHQHSTITVSGITFHESEEASIVMNDPRGKVIFEKCKWENNEGEAIVVDGKYSGKNQEEEYYGDDDFMLPPGKVNPFASTEPTMPAETTETPMNFLFGSTVSVMSTEFSAPATTEAPLTSAFGARALETLSAVGPKSLILIRKSTFTGNKGKATIAVDSFSEDEGLDSGSSSTGPIYLELEESTFSSERVATSVIVTSGAKVSSTGSVFEKNTGSSMIQTNSGTISITDTQFSNNDVTGGDGVVVVDSDSKVGDTNCVQESGDGATAVTSLSSSRGDLASDVCEGTVVMMVVGTCRPFGQVCDPDAPPESLPIPVVVEDSNVVDGSGLEVDNEVEGGSDSDGENEVEGGSDLDGENEVEGGSDVDGGNIVEDGSDLDGENEVEGGSDLDSISDVFGGSEATERNETAPIIDVAEPEIVKDCHGNWTDLKHAVENRIVDGIEVLSHIGSLYFKICPNSTLDASSGPIVIDYDYVTVQCGNDGKKSDNCQIIGGFVHFHIVGASTDNELAGLRMSSSKGSSIIAAGTKDASLKISDCEWMSNSGESAVLIRNNATVDASDNTEILGISSMLNSSEPAMKVVMSGVGFMQNVLTYGTVVNVGGSLSIDKGRFNGNEVRVGDIAVMKGGDLIISDSCFDGSASMVPGTIFIDETSFLQENVNTFGFLNTDGGFDKGLTCTDIFTVAVGSDCSNETSTGASCNGTCTTFTSKTCPLDIGSLPTVTPGKDKKDTPDTGYVRSRNSTDKASVIPIVVAVLVVSFILIGLAFIIFKRTRKKPSAYEASFQGDLADVDADESI